jgi:hypothetical protein
MILARITFGRRGRRSADELEDIATTYLALLLRNGQVCDEYFYAWSRGVLNAYVHLAGPTALAVRHHSRRGLQEQRAVVRAFGGKPGCTILDDAAPRRSARWQDAPILFLFTHAFDLAPSVLRGESGVPVPSYLLPITDENREELFCWQSSYREHDAVWLGSGALEIPAYRELAEPASELSQSGRSLCRAIENATGIPTHYYLMRYWGRTRNESARKCPGCRRTWRTEWPEEGEPFWHFHFRCDTCRLVSHLGVSTDGGRHVRIGEYAKWKKG